MGQLDTNQTFHDLLYLHLQILHTLLVHLALYQFQEENTNDNRLMLKLLHLLHLPQHTQLMAKLDHLLRYQDNQGFYQMGQVEVQMGY
jgi:hypothetical protein